MIQLNFLYYNDVKDDDSFKRIFKKITKHTCINFSLISQLKIPGLSFLYSSIFFSTSGVATRGFDPPITPGRIEPVSYFRNE